MSHEQSETIQLENGRWANVYGRALPRAGQQLPGTPDYGSVDEAVNAARSRSESFGTHQHNDETEDFEFRLRMEKEAEAGAATPTPDPGIYGQFVKPAILPTGGAIAGAALGGGIGTPFGMTVPGGIAGAAIGSAIGEAGNQALGITEPSLSNIGLSGGLSAAAGAAGAVARPLVRLMNPKSAAQALNAVAPKEVAERLSTMAPGVPSRELFKHATDSKDMIVTPKTTHTIDLMLDDLTKVSTGVQKSNKQVIDYLDGLKTLLNNNASGVTPLALQREMEGAGRLVKSVETTGGTGSGAIKNVFKSLVADLDDAANIPGAAVLKQARDTFKKESVLGEIGESIEKSTRTMRGHGGDIQFNPSAVLNEIKKNPFYTQALNASEREEIESTLKLLNKIPSLGPGAGQSFGSGQIATMMRRSAIGGAVGGAVGGVPGASAGAAVGAMSGPVIEFGRNLSTALQMKTGRAILKEMLTQSKGVATPQVTSVVAAYAEALRAGQVQDDVQTMPEVGTVKEEPVK